MPIFRYNETAGNYYAYLIEGHGDDANDGLTPETAVATLDRLVEILDTYAGASRRHAVIVKKRIYNEGITYARNGGKPITFEFVGGCEIDGSGAARMSMSVNSDRVIGALIINYDTSPFFNQNIRGFFEKCVLNNNAYGLTANWRETQLLVGHGFIECLGVNSALNNNNTDVSYSGRRMVLNIQTCTFINCFTNSTGSGATYKAPVSALNTNFYNCNNWEVSIDTDININYCNVFGILFGKTNTEIRALGQNLNGISANPQFTDPTNGQYTVKQSSPCLYRGEGGEHIGIGEGFYLQANILFFQQSAINNFQLTTGRLGFIDPLDNAFIETNPIDIGQIITLEKAELAAILPVVAGEFTAGPVHYSHWYPAYSAASTYHKGAGVTDSAIKYRSKEDDNLNNTPASSATEWERLTWESGVSYAAGKIVQYTDDKWYKANTATSTSWVAGEWDEVVMTREWNLQVKTGRTYDECDAADWATIPYNTTPYLDTAGLGNSDDDYDPLTAAVMVFRFIAVRIDAKTIV